MPFRFNPCTHCCICGGCADGHIQPDEFEVTLANLSDGLCTDCETIAGTYVLAWKERTANACVWEYLFPDETFCVPAPDQEPGTTERLTLTLYNTGEMVVTLSGQWWNKTATPPAYNPWSESWSSSDGFNNDTNAPLDGPWLCDELLDWELATVDASGQINCDVGVPTGTCHVTSV